MIQGLHYKAPVTRRRTVEPADLYIDHHDHGWQRLKRYFIERKAALSERMALRRSVDERIERRAHQVREQLEAAGLSKFDLLRSETHQIARLLHDDETIVSAMSGLLQEGGAALLAITNRRVIYLNQIGFFTGIDELPYNGIIGISAEFGRFDATVTLHTSVGDFTLHRVHLAAAEQFVEYVEAIAIEVTTIGAP